MLNKDRTILRRCKPFSFIVVITAMLGLGNKAQALTADDVLNKMSVEERTGYLSGVIAGLAYSRWLVDKPDESGMNCIVDWYYSGGDKNQKKIHSWFERHLDKPAGALLYVLTKKQCGELVGSTQ